ncbi:dicarboxylate/amino acid:cation symporter [Sedimentibacter sp. MB31-C6]|uniref:dicarboxylate/amino acid:cation symporter n=1 Tax=Sedimentibacter sp. MB31-C6 TaxID=3109366 RepID=UPI002DDD3FEA|nr:dicarboxylate/amino acid:cation symporter [Sedimentibacter sp. MB36-C1]WSI03701.1 dicarboxylate/amino acid:cation symporter [Sedimentibacter sp. MB36-C1]
MKIFGKKIGLTSQVFLAMILGAIFGLVIGEPMTKVGFIGTIWLNMIKMIVIPMVIVTIVTGIISQKDVKSLGRISVRIMSYYIITTLIAAAIGIIVATIVKPGNIASFTGLASKEIGTGTDVTIGDFFTSMFSSNMFNTFSEGNILQTLIIAILIGVAILRMKTESLKTTIINGFNALSEMVFSLIGMIMIVSPIGVFFLMADSFATYGAGIFTSMATLAGTYYLACIMQILLVYGGVLWFKAGINPIKFIKDSAELWVYTISTCSSVASIPVNIKVAKEKFGVPESISGFTVPLGSQMNYDGSVLLYGVVIVFISQVVGVPLSVGIMLKIILLSAIFSTGGGGIPGSGIVKLLVMVEAFGLPTEIVGIIAAFYRLFDMGTTTNNCLGDLAGTIFVSKLEEKSAKKATN